MMMMTMTRNALRWTDDDDYAHDSDDAEDGDDDDGDDDGDDDDDDDDYDDDDDDDDKYLVLPDGPRVGSEPANSDHHNWATDHLIISSDSSDHLIISSDSSEHLKYLISKQ